MASWFDALTSLVAGDSYVPAGPSGRRPALSSTPGQENVTAVADRLRLETSRRGHYQDYETMDAEAPEAHRALDVFADTAAHSEGDAPLLQLKFNAPGVEEVIRGLNRNTKVFERAWATIRSTRKNGDQFGELVFDTAGVLRRVKDLPAREVRRVLDPYGVPDPYPWRQVGRNGEGRDVAQFREWQIVHWADIPAGETYGFRRSQLSAARRPWKALEMSSNAILAERVLRTGARLAFQVDVTGLSTDEALEYLRGVKSEYARTRTHSVADGKRGTQYAPLTPMDDIWLPWTAGGPQKPVDVLHFGADIGPIDDVKFHYARYLGSLEVPQYMLGISEDLRSRSATAFIDASFIRGVLRAQVVYLRGLCAVLDRALYAAGFEEALTGDREKLYSASFPGMRLADEKLRWEIAYIRAQVAKIYGVDLSAVTQEFVLTYFLGLTEEESAAAASDSAEYDAAKAAARAPAAAADVSKAAAERFGLVDPLAVLAKALGVEEEEAAKVAADLRAAAVARARPPSSGALLPTGGNGP